KPIKTIGTHTVAVKLHDSITGHVSVETVAAN
ncbi:50S ribosomal protein L9, partial [Cutibacterium granulosum DSM 20700]